jgi:hypothetical protein
MQYFVSAENSSYFYWQLELLIESFKLNGIDDKLVIFLAQNDDPKIKGYSKNIISHKNKFEHENFGKENNCLSLNKPYAILQALSGGYIKYPFALIHPDMILKKPIEQKFEEDIVVDTYWTPNAAYDIEKYINNLLEKREVTDRDKIPKRIPSFGVIVFNNAVEDLFFHSIINKIKKFKEERNLKFSYDYAAWELSFFELIGTYRFAGVPFSSSLLDSVNNNFIHYKFGIPPYFNKKYYDAYKILNSRSSPYDAILEHNPSENSNYLHQIIKMYKKSI